MAAEAAQKVVALEAQAQRLLGAFTRAGYEQVAPGIISPPACSRRVGEALRAPRLTDPEGEGCACAPTRSCRPAGCIWRATPSSVPARYCYNGPASVIRPAAPTVRTPGSSARPAGVLRRRRPRARRCGGWPIVQALRDAGLEQYQLRIGDLGLFSALLEALPMPKRWRRLLRHHFWRPEAFHAELARLTSAAALKQLGVPRELVERLDPDMPEEAQGFVAEYLDQSGLELIGARTLPEIAERVLAEVADARETPLAPQTAALIESYVAITAPARDAGRRIEALQRANRIDLGPALDAFRRRLELLEAAGVATTGATFSAEFGRDLEYYTGFVFEISVSKLGPKSPIAGGGRYDSLLADVGAATAVPAVGSSIHTERLLAVLSGAAP